MTAIARTRRMARYTRRTVRRSLRREAVLESMLNEWRVKASEPMSGFVLCLMSFALGSFLAALIITALLA